MNKKLYIKKPLAIIQDKRLTPLEQDYLCLIAALQNADGCTASNNYFATYFAVSRPRAVEVITGLRKKGFIESNEKKQGKKIIGKIIRIIDSDSKEALLTNSKESLLMDSKETPARIVRKSGFDSKESPAHIIRKTLKDTIKYSPTSVEVGLASLLFKKIRERKPDFKKPNLRQWAGHIDLMIRRDNRKPENIKAVILWCQADTGNGKGWDGWQDNVLSTAKLRKKFDDLELKMRKNIKPEAKQIPKLCLVRNCKKPASIEIPTGSSGRHFLCEDCHKDYQAAPDVRNWKNRIIPKNRLDVGQIKAMILKQKVERMP
jgi:hypothetical protein